ncbi:hypothetical protein FZEAL_8538 [Fusarium zealandicum]|uniref:Uncharacterized protein n=1 Tax=Fusarium zealandicum TaxID=1053134 RepID=A0A8H4UE59_9HYPO|nr:hypothetical protein FZEAL_8538 [Fusarium zealandicum]
MAVESLTRDVVAGRYLRETSSTQSSNSQVSTYDILDRFPQSTRLRDKFRQLKDRLLNVPQHLSPDDLSRWQENQQDFIRLLGNHGPFSEQVRQGASFDAKMIGDRKLVIIGCKTGKIRARVKRDLEESGALDLVRDIMGFDDVEVNTEFMGHLAKTSLPSASICAEADLGILSSLGSRLRIHGPGNTESITTVGGVILIDGKAYGLTSGCVISRQDLEVRNMAEAGEDTRLGHTNRKLLSQRIVAHNYGSLKSFQGQQFASQQWGRDEVPQHCSTNVLGDTQANCPDEASDWALVELPRHNVPPNAMLDRRRKSSGEWLWPRQATDEDILVQKTLSEADLAGLMKTEDGRVACLTYTSSSRPVPGFIAAGSSSIVLDGAIFSVLRVDMDDPLGSWVMVGNAVCGVIIAGSREDTDHGVQESGRMQAFWAYIIPIIDIFDSISHSLSATVSLATLVDYRIGVLQSRRRDLRWTSNMIPPRFLDMELLLAQQKEQRRGHGGIENMRLHARSNNILVPTPPPPNPSWISRYVLKGSIGIQHETIYRLLQLGEICPLSATFRPGLRQWAKNYRKSRFKNRRAFACVDIIDQCLQTEAGENLLGLLIFLCKTQQEPSHLEGETSLHRHSHRTAWLAQLLSSLLTILDIPKIAIPSTSQLQVFVSGIISAFDDRELRHLYLILDGMYPAEKEKTSKAVWSISHPSHQQDILQLPYGLVWRPLLRSFFRKSPVQDHSAFRGTPATWNHTVSFTSRILALLYKVYMGDRSHVLVYSGRDAVRVGFYADVMLSLEVQFRNRDSHGSYLTPSPYRESERIASFGQTDVVIYITIAAHVEDVCEIIDRKSVDFPDENRCPHW